MELFGGGSLVSTYFLCHVHVKLRGWVAVFINLLYVNGILCWVKSISISEFRRVVSPWNYEHVLFSILNENMTVRSNIIFGSCKKYDVNNLSFPMAEYTITYFSFSYFFFKFFFSSFNRLRNVVELRINSIIILLPPILLLSITKFLFNWSSMLHIWQGSFEWS